ncbi:MULTISPECIES: CGNR zinc finger domain-containing protein [Streptosporangium]|uniref:RNA-binding Zn ribbon-like protein n=1 Tax=Streptosporangium brasiliense TaxID=47480 RepID=A0ABT9R0E3_9ACTN|nr:CGNR zinc finger domain-containing protein [Streptosporangium brasiliense]MDP9862696.1 putative RNA-binding Zn ribbon-like protein [Streptosporangium brasiliense]
MGDLIPLTGEPLALDLVNTRPAVGDLLATPADLLAWLGLQADRLPDAACGTAELAEAAADLPADPAVMHVRQCEAEDCVMLFLSAHPCRRWCSADRCGNRVRVARYYRRHRTA